MLPTIKLSAIFLLVFLTACQMAPVRQVEVKETRDIKMGEKAEPVQLKKVAIKIKRGKVIGGLSAGIICVKQGDLNWKGGRVSLSSDDFTEVFRDELENAGYTVVGNPDALFEDPSDYKARYLIGGLINDLEANICYPMAGFGNFNNSKGNAYVKVNWQIYSPLQRKIVYTVDTEGAYERKEAANLGSDDIIINAFGVATQNLLADKQFYDLITATPPSLEPNKNFTTIDIPDIKPFKKTIHSQMNKVRSGVVTVISSSGHGSGFFISSDGYLLTNQHVSGDNGTLKIKLATGREVLGEVVRSDRGRDVALIKVEDGAVNPLPIRHDEPNIGEEIYAIGSPLDENLNTTVSKGVVSSYRTEEGARYIQSDVNVLPGSSGGALVDAKGNVVGITVAGRTFKGVMAGINFFIPIHEALKFMKIDLKDM